jgi:hypothetical protein
VLEPLPSTFGTTRDALHAVAEQVLAPARYRADRRIGLVPAAGGFGTPTYGDGEVARVDGVDIVYEGPQVQRRAPITTLAGAAVCVGVPAGPLADVYPPATNVPVDAPLAVDEDAAAALAAWIALGGALLEQLRRAHEHHDASTVQLWPEHFDLGCTIGDERAGTRANYGASPGDDVIGEPYLYVGPWDEARKRGPLAAYPFGGALRYGELQADPERFGGEFFGECAGLMLTP